MTERQKKLIEKYIRLRVNEQLNEGIDMNIVKKLTEKLINDIDAKSSGVIESELAIPQAIFNYLKKQYNLR